MKRVVDYRDFYDFQNIGRYLTGVCCYVIPTLTPSMKEITILYMLDDVGIQAKIIMPEEWASE